MFMLLLSELYGRIGQILHEHGDMQVTRLRHLHIVDIFPELNESEWEKVRKELLDHCKDKAEKYHNDPKYKNISAWITWLERQGKQKPFDYANANIQQKDFSSIKPDDLIEEYYQYQADDIIDIVTEKSADKVEHKFKVGDWITNCDYTWKIVEVKPLDYILQSQDGHIVDDTISHVDSNFHLWNIKDAKDGDVLACKSGWTCIFKTLVNYETFSSYCFMDNTKWFCEKRSECHTLKEEFIKAYNGKIYPATKEQRETLLRAMADAGYAFDFEKKKLKKNLSKPDMIQWRGDNLKEIIEFTGKDKNFDKWFKSFAEYEKYVSEHDNVFKLFNENGSHFEVPVGAWIVKTPDGYNVASKAIFKNKPTEWSEEDKRKINRIYSILRQAADTHAYSTSCRLIGDKECIELQDFLKSLRHQNTWKPSEDQMKALAGALSLAKNCGEERAFDLRTLHEQLEKLREE